MVLGAQFVGLTSFHLSTPPPSSKQGRRVLSRTHLLLPSSFLPFNCFSPPSQLSGATPRLTTSVKAGAHSGSPQPKLPYRADVWSKVLREGAGSGFKDSSERVGLVVEEEEKEARVRGQDTHIDEEEEGEEEVYPTKTLIQSSEVVRYEENDWSYAESRELGAAAENQKALASTTRSNELEGLRGSDFPDLDWFAEEPDVECSEEGISLTDGEFDLLGPGVQQFSAGRQRLKVGRRVFLTGDEDYKRWMPRNEEEVPVQGISEELPYGEEIPYAINPNAESGVSPQTKDGDDDSSGETEGEEFEPREEEGVQLSVESSEASEGENSQDLLVEFLKKRSERWGDHGDVWLRERGRSTENKVGALVGDRALIPKKQTHVPPQNMDIPVRVNGRSSEKSSGIELLSPSEKAVPTQVHLSETATLLIADEKLRNPAALAQEIVEFVKKLPPNASLETFLTPLCGKISTNDGNLVLKSLGEARLPWPMLSFFQWMRVHEPILLDSRSFCTVFTHLGKLGSVDQALLQYKNMPEDGSFHCVQVYNSLLGALAGSDRQEKIPLVLQEMEERNIKRDAVTYSILITATKGGAKERVETVWGIFDDMLREGVRPSMSVYGSLIKAFCDEGHLKKALLVSLSMEKMGMRPNVIIYNTLIDGHGKALQLEEAEGLLLEMKERRLHPTESTYNALINGYGRSGQLDVAEQLVLEMHKEGLKPNAFTYTSLISAYGKHQMSEKAVDVFLRMRKIGLIPTTHTYTALINAYAEGGWHEKAQRAFDNMIREGLKPTVETYTALLDGYRRAGDLEMVRYLWNTIKEDGCVLTKVTYRTIMDAFCKYGFYVEARDVMDEFRKHSLQPDTMIFNMLLNAYARGGICTKLQKVMLEMQAAGCEPDSFTYCTLIYSFIRLRDFTNAFKYDSEMLEKGLLPEPAIYWKMRRMLDSKYALKLENDKKADSGQDQKKSGKNPQRLKRNFKRYRKKRPVRGVRGSERAKALWKDKEK